MAAAPASHDHEWRLLAVDFDDGTCTRVFGCCSCGTERIDRPTTHPTRSTT